MKFEIYSIKDSVTGQFADIRPMVNRAQAIRWFDDFCGESKIGRDLQLYSLGSYDVQTGEITSSVEFVKGGADNG